MHRNPSVVVGCDDSPSAVRAVRLAAEEAARRSCHLHVVHVSRVADTAAVPRLAKAVGIARGYLDPSRIHTHNLVGTPAAHLLAKAEGAQLVVLGHNGPYFLGDTLGAVSQLLVTSLGCPLLVLAGTDDSAGDPEAASSGVVAGVKHLNRAEDVLMAAFAEAELRGCALEIVHSWQYAREHGVTWVRAPLHSDPVRYGEDLTERLDEAVRNVAGKFPDVPFTVSTPRSEALAALTAAAQRAALLVVGAPRFGPLRGTVHRSVGQTLLSDDRCPVMFVPR
jgi:nucleotide-binding universal stress UspA family protein